MVATLARYADVWNKVNTGQPVEGDTETRRGILTYALLMIDYENRFHQFEAGKLDGRSWESRLRVLDRLVTLPMYELWRQSPGGLSRGADFLDLVDGIAKKANENSTRGETNS